MDRRAINFKLTLVSLLLPLAAGNSIASDIFQPYQTIGEALLQDSWPESVAIGDVNNDGRQDVVLATSSYFDPENDYHIFVFLQNGAGEIEPTPVKYPAGNGESIAIADVNNDGKNDVVVTAANANGVFLQNTGGSLEPMRTYPSAHQSHSNTHKLSTGDFNNDGLTDVVAIDWGTQSHSVDVFLQNAGNTLTAPAIYTVEHGGYDDLDVGDVNNDGLTDIIVMSGQAYAYDNIGVLLQNDTGTFDAPTYYDLGGNELTHGVAVGDVNNDQRQDIVVSYGGNSPSAKIGVFPQNNAGTIDPATSYSAYDCPEPVAISDLNSDGKNDILAVHGGWNALGLFLQNDTGGLDPYELYTLPYASHYNPHGLALGDLNNDGATDVAIADYNHGLVLLYNQLTAGIELKILTNGKDSSRPPGVPVRISNPISWSFVVSNSGSQDLTDIIVTNPRTGTVACPASVLAMEETMTCSASETAQQGYNSVTVTVTGKGQKGQQVTDTATGYYLGKATVFPWIDFMPVILRGKRNIQ